MGQQRIFNPTARGVPLDERFVEEFKPPRPAPQGIAPPTVQYYPPWISRPDVFQDFYFRTPIGTAVPAASSISPASVSFTTQAGQKAVITSVTIFVDNPDATLDVDWTLTFNSVPVPGWTRGSFARLATNLSISWDQQAVRIPEGTVVGWTITNRSATPWTVGVEFDGWFYPTSEEVRILGHATS